MVGPMPRRAFDIDNLRVAGLQGRDAGGAIGLIGGSQTQAKAPTARRVGAATGGAVGPRGYVPVGPAPTPPRMPGLEEIIGGPPGSGQSGSSTFGFDPGQGLGSIGEAQARAAEAMGALEAQYERRKQELREQYQLSETPEERASIQFVVAMIDAQREAGTKVIERVYSEAIEGAHAQAAETRELGLEAGARQAETFEQAAQDTSGLLQELNQGFGGPMGAASRPVSEVSEGAVAGMMQRGQSERAFDERMFNLTADDIAVLGEAMRPEMGAQVGGLQRLATQATGAATAQHQMEVNRRIAAERMQKAAAMQQLGGQFDQRRFGLEDQQMAMLMQAAQMRADNERAAAQLRASSAAQANQLTPQQEWALRQQEQQHQMEMENYLREAEIHRQRSALRQGGASRRDSDLATALGLGTPFAESMIPGLNPLGD